MFNFADLVASLSLDAADFISGAQAATSAWQQTESAVGTSAANMSTHVGSIGEYFTNLKDTIATNVPALASAFGQMLDNLANSATGMIAGGATLTAALTGPIVALGTAAFSTASQLNAATLSFTTMMHSGEQAKEFLNDLRQFAAETPFEFGDLTRAAQRMMAFGFAAKDVIPMMTALGDAAGLLGGGPALIERMTVALGQMQAKGKVSAQEMAQLAESGIGAWKYLADAIGVSIPEAMKMAEKGTVDSGTAIKAILAGMTKDFGGGMAQFAQTVEGRFSTLKDNVTAALGDLGQKLLPIASNIIETFLMPAADFLKKLIDGFIALPEPVQNLAIALAAVLAAAGPVIAAVGLLITGVMALAPLLGTAGLTATLAALGPILLGVAGAVAAVWSVWELWKLDVVQAAVTAIAGAIGDFWNNTLSPFLDVIVNLGSAFIDFAGSIVSSGLQALWDGLTVVGGGLKEILLSLWNEVLVPLGGAFMDVYNAVSPLLDIFGTIGTVLATLAVAYLAAEWDMFKLAATGVWSILSAVGSVVKDVVISTFQLFGTVIKDVGGFLSSLLKPAIDTVVSAFQSFVGWLMQIPGVAALVNQLSAPFDTLKTKITTTLQDAQTESQKLQDKATTNNAAIATSYKDVADKSDDARKGIGDAGTAAELAKEKKKLLSDANTVLHTSESKIATLLKETSVPAHKSLATATTDLATARTKAKDAVTNVEDAEKKLKDTMANSKSTSQDLKDATENLKLQNFLASEAASNLKDAEDNLTRAKQDDKTATKELDDQSKLLEQTIGNLIINLPEVGLGVDSVRASVASMSGVMSTAQTDAFNTQNALKNMGITPKEDLQKLADQAFANFNTIKDSGTASATEIDKAQKAYLDNLKAYYVQSGKDLPPELQNTLTTLEGKYNTHATTVNNVFTTMKSNIQTSISQLSSDLVKSLWEGDGSFGDKAKSALITIGEQVTTAFITPATTAISTFISDGLSKLLSKLIGDDGILGGLTKIGSKMGSIFGGASSAGGSIFDGVVGQGGSIAGSAGGGAGAATGIASSGLSGILTAAFTGVSAVTDVLSMFGVGVQGSINDHLKDIRNDTWYIAWALGEGGAKDAIVGLRDLFRAYSDGFSGWFHENLMNLSMACESSRDELMKVISPNINQIATDVTGIVTIMREQAMFGTLLLDKVDSIARPNNVTIQIAGNFIGDEAGAEMVGEATAKAMTLQGVGY